MFRFLSDVPIKIFLSLSLIFFAPGSVLSAMTANEDSLTVAAVQFEILPEMLLSPEVFQNAVEKAAARAMAEGKADLLIFPEYLGVFSALIPWGHSLNSGKPFLQIWEVICQDFPADSAPPSIKEFFLDCSEQNDAFLDKLWRKLARKYEVYILGGSRFTSFGSRGGRALYNQAVVYAPDGEVCYRQNKFFLTEFEEEVPELTPGRMKDCQGFWIKDKLVRLTICRDTFLEEWEEVYREGFLWIDIKANGTAYTADQRKLFKRALPARLPDTKIPWGVTVCLTGHVMDLFWEGESGIIAGKGDEGTVPVLTSSCFDGFDVLRWTLN